MVNEDGNENVLDGEDKKRLLNTIKYVFRSPTQDIYQVYNYNIVTAQPNLNLIQLQIGVTLKLVSK